MAGTAAIYSITNKLNKKVYVGQSWHVENRFRDYKTARANSHLSAAFAKYGFDNFHFGIIETFPPTVSQEHLDFLEDAYIVAGDLMNPEVGYNMRRGGSHGRHSDESRQLIAQIQTGRKLSEEHKRKIGEKSTGRYYSPETRAKIGDAHRGMKHTKETRRKLSESHKGKKPSRESIEKMKQTRIRLGLNSHSEETKRKISAANKGRERTKEWRENQSKSQKGKPWSAARRAAHNAGRQS
jgi:group I intron endonuclease